MKIRALKKSVGLCACLRRVDIQRAGIFGWNRPWPEKLWGLSALRARRIKHGSSAGG